MSPEPEEQAVAAPDKAGRPNDYAVEIGDTICERLVDGETLREICADPTMPDKATVHRWLAQDKDFHSYYVLARKFQFEELLDDTIAIIDDTQGDRIERVRRDGKVVTVWDHKNLARSVLRCDIRNWVADRLMPKNHLET